MSIGSLTLRSSMATIVIIGLVSCTATQRGALIGAGAGGAAGALVGHAVGATAEGAIIGAAVGGAAGAIIGAQMDAQKEDIENSVEGATVERVGEALLVTFDSGILFDFDSADLKGEARSNLSNLAASLDRFDNTDVLVVGHTDSQGSDNYNLQLSVRRAESATNYLVAQGVSRERLRPLGRGEGEPIASNETSDGRSQNRRVEIVIVASEEFQEEAQEQVGE